MGYTNVKEYLGMILKVRRKKVLFWKKRFVYLVMSRRQAGPLNNMSSKDYMGCFHLEEENY